MDDLGLILLFGFTIIVVCLLMFLILRYFFHTRIGGIEKSSDTISQMSQGIIQQSKSLTNIMDTTLKTLKSDVSTQLKELREMQQNLQTTQTTTQASFDKFVNLVRMRPQARGEVGEGIVRWVLSTLPSTTWKEQVEISGGRVDFIIYLPPDDERILIDSKFTFPEELLETENIVAADKKTIEVINKRTLKHAGVLTKYLVPGNTNVGFVLMYIPDILFVYISETTYKELTNKKVIPVNVSGLLSTILIISKQIQAFRVGEAIKRLESIKSSFDVEIDNIQRITKKSKKQLRNALKNINKIDNQLEQSRTAIFTQFGLIEETSE